MVWNCAGAFHKKWRHLVALQPDIAIIPEACSPDQIEGLGHSTSEWIGRLPYKGLAVMSFGEWRIERTISNPSLQWVLPMQVDGPESFELYAVWAMNRRAQLHPERYAGLTQPEALLDEYEPGRSGRPVIIAGDFNSNANWDTARRPTFSRLQSRYDDHGLVSLYHRQTGEAFGDEGVPTHWWRDRRKDGPSYHIDYVWSSSSIAERARLDVGSFEDWVTDARSDHAALVVDIDPSRN